MSPIVMVTFLINVFFFEEVETSTDKDTEPTIEILII